MDRFTNLSDWLLGCYFAPDEGGGAGEGEGDGKPDDAADTDDTPESGKTDGKTFDASYVKSLRDEAAKARREKKDLETRLKALEDEKLTDSEKRERDLKEAQARAEAAEQRAHQAEVRAVAAEAGAVNPNQVARLIDPDVTDVSKAVAALKRSDPYLFTRPGAGSADGGAGGAPRGGNVNDAIRRMAGRS